MGASGLFKARGGGKARQQGPGAGRGAKLTQGEEQESVLFFRVTGSRQVLRGRVQRPLCPHGASRGQHCIVTGLSLTWGRAGEAPPLCRVPSGKGCVKALAGPAT